MSKSLTAHTEADSLLSLPLFYPNLLASLSSSLGMVLWGLVLVVDPFTGLSPRHSKKGYAPA